MSWTSGQCHDAACCLGGSSCQNVMHSILASSSVEQSLLQMILSCRIHAVHAASKHLALACTLKLMVSTLQLVVSNSAREAILHFLPLGQEALLAWWKLLPKCDALHIRKLTSGAITAPDDPCTPSPPVLRNCLGCPLNAQSTPLVHELLSGPRAVPATHKHYFGFIRIAYLLHSCTGPESIIASAGHVHHTARMHCPQNSMDGPDQCPSQ
jgi:hypothetical protein